jgi:cyclic pyranopterin phosphate synthase
MAEQKSPEFTHFDAQGRARMVDVSAKAETLRIAEAAGTVSMGPEAYALVKSGSIAKGDVLGVARIAGILAAKKVHELIPLAHPLLITSSKVDFAFQDDQNLIHIRAAIGICGKTGVEMEALTAVSVAALTIYDMCKAVDKSMVISDIRLLKKSGGKSGTYIRQDHTE